MEGRCQVEVQVRLSDKGQDLGEWSGEEWGGKEKGEECGGWRKYL
jgi:hypothetical protein